MSEAAASPEAIWRAAYADAAAWPQWNPELAEATLDGPFAPGAVARVRFRLAGRRAARALPAGQDAIAPNVSRTRGTCGVALGEPPMRAMTPDRHSCHMGMTATQIRHQIEQLTAERLAAIADGLAADPDLLDEMDDELDALRDAYVGYAVVEIAALRADLGEKNVG